MAMSGPWLRVVLEVHGKMSRRRTASFRLLAGTVFNGGARGPSTIRRGKVIGFFVYTVGLHDNQACGYLIAQSLSTRSPSTELVKSVGNLGCRLYSKD